MAHCALFLWHSYSLSLSVFFYVYIPVIWWSYGGTLQRISPLAHFTSLCFLIVFCFTCKLPWIKVSVKGVNILGSMSALSYALVGRFPTAGKMTIELARQYLGPSVCVSSLFLWVMWRQLELQSLWPRNFIYFKPSLTWFLLFLHGIQHLEDSLH